VIKMKKKKILLECKLTPLPHLV